MAPEATAAEVKMTLNRWAKAISPRHEAALKLLTGEDCDLLRDGIKAEADLVKVQARIAKAAEARARLDAKAKP